MARWVRKRYRGLNPFELLEADNPEWKGAERPAATIKQFQATMKYLPEHARPLWHVSALTGARLTALCELKHEDVGDTHITVRTKRGQERQHLIAPPLRQLIDDSPGKTHVFLNGNGTPWNKDSFAHCLDRARRREIKRAEKEGEEPDAPHITAHSIRHLWGTTAADLGYSPDLIQAALGHESRSNSEQYVHQGHGRPRQSAYR